TSWGARCKSGISANGLRLQSGEQRPRGCGDVLVAHQRLADKESLDARSGQTLAVGVTGYAALGDHDLARRHVRLEPLADVERGRESVEVAIVDANETAFEGKRPLQF